MKTFHSIDSLAVEKKRRKNRFLKSKTGDIYLKQEAGLSVTQGFPLFPQAYTQEKPCFPVHEREKAWSLCTVSSVCPQA